MQRCVSWSQKDRPTVPELQAEILRYTGRGTNGEPDRVAEMRDWDPDVETVPVRCQLQSRRQQFPLRGRIGDGAGEPGIVVEGTGDEEEDDTSDVSSVMEVEGVEEEEED